MSESAEVDRVALAESFLQEAVYRSRGDQAGATLMKAGSAGCGLGEKPSVVLDLSPRAEEIFGQLTAGQGVGAAAAAATATLEALRDQMAAWVRKQDALDRKRNHFMKDFRNAHGFDRSTYDEAQLKSFEAGLGEVNAEVGAARREAALGLLETLRGR